MTPLSDNLRGAAFMLASMTAFTLNDACMKALSGEVPLFQAIFMRSVIVVVLLGALALRSGALRGRLSRKDRFLVGLRTIVEMGAAFFFISALFNMPIANVTAIIQALPLTICLAGAVFLGEAVGWRRMSAIIVGFVGVLLIVRPGGEGFSIYSIYVLLAVACVTVRDLAARRMSRSVPTLRVALVAVFGVMVFSGLGTLAHGDWVATDGLSLAKLLGASVFVLGGYIFSVSAMRSGEIGFVAQFRYSSLLVALIIGFFVFDEWPEQLTLIGSAIIVATGLFTLYRERRVS